MKKCKNEVGNSYGKWLVLKREPNGKNGQAMWLCKCDCGTISVVKGIALRSGGSKSCGCLNKEINKRNAKNIEGRKYNRLIVIKRVENSKGGSARWLCRCDCGRENTVLGTSLRNGHTKSCGCLSDAGNRIEDLTGQRFGRWLVLERGKRKNTAWYWKCKCDCGTEREVKIDSLKNGKSKSCGCLVREINSELKYDLTGYKFSRLAVIKRVENNKFGHVCYLCKCDCGKDSIVTSNQLRNGHTKSCGCLSREISREIGLAHAVDITNEKYGRLLALKRVKDDRNGTFWLCKCDCGNEKIIRKGQLISGRTKSCGCLNSELSKQRAKEKRSHIKIGDKFTRLTIIGESYDKENRFLGWKCKCDCGKDFTTITSTLNNGSTKSCGCLNQEKRAERGRASAGSNNAMWNPNLTDEDRQWDRSYAVEKSKEWRKEIYSRDGYVCQCCGDFVGGNLVAHHIDGYDWCKEGRFNIENGITICDDCHKIFHKEYGYGKNTKEQFLEWREIQIMEM